MTSRGDVWPLSRATSKRCRRIMLERLRLQNVGPAPDIKLACRRSVNVLTDNGLGKILLTDAAWWALTENRPHDVKSRLI